MIRSFEALLAAIIVISFMIYIVSYPHFSDTGLKYESISSDKIRHCKLSYRGYNLSVLILKFNQSFDHACVKINYPANYTYAVSKEFIPSMGGDQILLQIEEYNGEPIFIYVTNETKGNSIECDYPIKEFNYTYVVMPSEYKLACEGIE